jgi:hypothetical protein
MTDFKLEPKVNVPDSQPPVVEVFVGILLFAASVGIAFHAWNLNVQGRTFAAVESFGISIVVAGGCLNPVNFIWLCLPFTRKDIAPSTPFASYSRVICGLGFIPFMVGLVGRHVTG